MKRWTVEGNGRRRDTVVTTILQNSVADPMIGGAIVVRNLLQEHRTASRLPHHDGNLSVTSECCRYSEYFGYCTEFYRDILNYLLPPLSDKIPENQSTRITCLCTISRSDSDIILLIDGSV